MRFGKTGSAVIVAASLGSAVTAFAETPAAIGTVVTRNSFGTATVIETFEGIAPIGSGDYPSLPIRTPMVFPSGVRMDLPNPSVSGTFGPYIVEFRGGGGFYGMSSSQSNLIPSGTAYLGQANPGLFTGDIRLLLPNPSARVGAYFATATNFDSGAVTFEAYDRQDHLLASQTVANVHFNNWKNTFVGLETQSGPIAYVMLRGNHASVLRVDDFMFEVPEPQLVGLLVGFALLSPRRVRRR